MCPSCVRVVRVVRRACVRACVRVASFKWVTEKGLDIMLLFCYYAVLLEVKSMNTHDLKRNREAMSGGIGTGG